jgi:hypothetical protein
MTPAGGRILPSDARNAALRDRGYQVFQDRHRPLSDVP